MAVETTVQGKDCDQEKPIILGHIPDMLHYVSLCRQVIVPEVVESDIRVPQSSRATAKMDAHIDRERDVAHPEPSSM